MDFKSFIERQDEIIKGSDAALKWCAVGLIASGSTLIFIIVILILSICGNWR